MEIWVDDQEMVFRQILQRIKSDRSGEVAGLQRSYGLEYKMNWGVPLTDLRKIASEFQPSHVLALKLWNRQWRETMILATLLDQPELVTEEQMDYWTKSFGNGEIAEQASANLWCRTPYAYAKALEWCRGKKHWVRYSAVHLTGRLAMTDRKSPDDFFQLFFDEFIPLARDPALSSVIYQTMIILAGRSAYLKRLVSDWTERIRISEKEHALNLAGEVEKGLLYF